MKVELNNAELSYLLGILEIKSLTHDYDDWEEMLIPRIAQKIQNQVRSFNLPVDELTISILNEFPEEEE
jgi:hypothetical protein